MKKLELHDWALSILLTILCYLIVNNFIIPMPFWKYFIIEALLTILISFRTFAIGKIKSQTSRKIPKS